MRCGAIPIVRGPVPQRPPTSMDSAAMASRSVSAPALLQRPVAPTPPPSTLHTRPKLKLPVGHKPFICFDTETTGLKPAIVCQIAYVVVEAGKVTMEYDQLLQLPQGAYIGRQAQAIHRISNRDCAQRGVDAANALELFARTCFKIMQAGGRIVAHNAKFDARAIRETRLAHNIIEYPENQALEDGDTFCTMTMSKSYSQLKDKANRRKAFKNEELYAHLYGSPPTWASLHNAADDIGVTTLNYAGGLLRGWW